LAINLQNRNLLKLDDSSPEEILFLLELSADLKAAKNRGAEQARLAGKNIALIFEKTSTRTRCAFEVAAFDQGANVSYIGPTGSQMRQKESMKDTARVLGRMYDGIAYRGYGQEVVEQLAEYSGVPVWNGLTTEFHPTQVLADFLTMSEHTHKPFHEIRFCFLGDGNCNTSRSLLIGAAKLGMDLRVASPKPCWAGREIVQRSQEIAGQTGGSTSITENVEEAVKGVDFLYTDVWISMGEPESTWGRKIEMLRPYQVNANIVTVTGNPDVKFMHCLPAFHNRETEIGEQIFERHNLDSMEVTEEIFESERSIVFDQAENRLHTIKAIMVATLATS
jgi:ornithine carbamoyltransferase